MPEGIRSALSVQPTQEAAPVAGGESLPPMPDMEETQRALLSPSNLKPPSAAPFDDPVAGETLALLSAGEINSCYAISDYRGAQPISPA